MTGFPEKVPLTITSLDKRFQSKTDRKYSLEYYRSLGMAHREKDGKQYFVVILMR